MTSTFGKIFKATLFDWSFYSSPNKNELFLLLMLSRIWFPAFLKASTAVSWVTFTTDTLLTCSMVSFTLRRQSAAALCVSLVTRIAVPCTLWGRSVPPAMVTPSPASFLSSTIWWYSHLSFESLGDQQDESFSPKTFYKTVFFSRSYSISYFHVF